MQRVFKKVEKEASVSPPDKSMKKISLSLLAGNDPRTPSLTPSAVCFDFIYGTGSEGLTAFERVLTDMEIGQTKELSLSSNEIEKYFGTLFVSLRQSLGLHLLPDSLTLYVELLACTEVEPREIVKAMAKSVGHGSCSGSCGCGCG